jgi:EthD domain
MYRVLHFLKRKPHLTHAQFRAHFERSHAPMAMKFCGHLFVQYQRHYADTALYGNDPRAANTQFGPKPWAFDLCSIWTHKSKEDFDEVIRLMQTPEYDHLFHEDEDRFIDRNAIMMVPVAVADIGTTDFDHKGTVFDTPTGVPSWDNWTDFLPK